MMDLMGGGWNIIVPGVIFACLMLAQGFDPAFASSIAVAGRIIDCIWNMVFGPIADSFFTKGLGRRFGCGHFFMSVGLILFACVSPLFWINVKDTSGAPSFTYHLCVYVSMEAIIAMLIIPWGCLPVEMTRDCDKHTSLSGSRMVISATGTDLVFLILAFLKSLPADVQADAHLYAGIAWDRPVHGGHLHLLAFHLGARAHARVRGRAREQAQAHLWRGRQGDLQRLQADLPEPGIPHAPACSRNADSGAKGPGMYGSMARRSPKKGTIRPQARQITVINEVKPGV